MDGSGLGLVRTDFTPVTITTAEFARFAAFLRDATGIELKPGKEQLVSGRLDRRLRHHNLASYSAYLALLQTKQGRPERRIAVDLLTTNETYFFREPAHFDLLRELARTTSSARRYRVWSAASSTGEEACSIAMTLHDELGPNRFDVVGTDVSSRAVAAAKRGLYPIAAAERIPKDLLTSYGLRGTGEHDGFMTVRPDIRAQIRFLTANLTQPLPDLGGEFDIIFLRNILIYFAAETKRAVVERLLETLRPDGTLLIGHAESLTGLGISGVTHVAPSVYRRTER